ncbi:phytanoyl-CoA dioxygenase family protein [Achromobacter sp. NPDC058515]|uniref:phytanoyl-CoA dioxygenase family protein n=1 Tax=Achromobacter sp. NPDC058515 TaxID=3346533 RepID=UPI003661440A
MTPLQTDFFFDQGYLLLKGFHPKKRMSAIRQSLLDELKRLSGGGSTPGSLHRLPVFQQIGKLSSLVKSPGLHEALMTGELVDHVARLAGRAPVAIQATQLLLSPARQGPWTLQGLNWHVDAKARTPDLLPGIQAFFLIDDVAPRGGATLALAGSHRAAASGSPLREALRAGVDLERKLQELGITVVEMAGRAGDVFLMDMRLLHTPSINSTANVRMMATSRCLLTA